MQYDMFVLVLTMGNDYQLGTFFVNGEWACSPFVTKSAHADNPVTFAPCVKSMTADFIRKIHNVPHGGLPYNFVRRIFVTYKIFHEKFRLIARGGKL